MHRCSDYRGAAGGRRARERAGGLGIHARRRALRLLGLRAADGVLGAGLTACVALGIAWIIGAVALQSTGSRPLRQDIQRSAILRSSTSCCRRPARSCMRWRASTRCRVSAVPRRRSRRPLGESSRRPASAGRPARGQGVGTACGLGIEGSGWIAAPDLVVTNAHVVAGESDTTVEVGGQRQASRRKPRLSTLTMTSQCFASRDWRAAAGPGAADAGRHRSRDPRLSP